MDTALGSAATQVAPDTFVVHDHTVDHLGRLVPCNVLLIRGAEPVVVDTGVAGRREHVLGELFSLVEPTELRWIVVSHDDADHTGNLDALLAAAPDAVVVADASTAHRLAPSRSRAVTDGARLDVGDRRLVLLAPPVYDGPALAPFDPTTGVWWAADTFATSIATPVTDVEDLDTPAWKDAMAAMAHELAPWLSLVAPSRFERTVERIESFGASTVVGAHTPTIKRRMIDAAWSVVRSLPSRP